jgi:hypothetical protein
MHFLPNASALELTYVAYVTIGVACNAWCLKEAVKDYRFVSRHYHWKLTSNRRRTVQEEADCIVVISSIRGELVKLLLQVFFLYLGILGTLLPGRPSMSAMRMMFFAATLAVVVDSVLGVLERRHILGMRGNPHD